jgi:hypothetical protein
MIKLQRSDLLGLEEYHRRRPQLRAETIAHKRNRKLPIGPHATLYFEDRVTIAYQVQEMLRAERIFESEAIDEELAAYNPLIPDGDNWKATFMIEYEDLEERRTALAQLLGIEQRVWVQVGDAERVYAIADEDLDRSADAKTSAVHFLRFQLAPAMATAAAQPGAVLRAGIDHAHYRYTVDPVPAAIADSLRQDLRRV